MALLSRPSRKRMRVGQAAEYLGVSRQKIQRLIESGQLPAEIIPGEVRRDRWVKREDLDRVFQPFEGIAQSA